MTFSPTWLILSINEYDWMKVEERIKEIGPKKCYVLIIGIDDTYLEGHEGLCKDAIYAQKIHDVYKFGKKLGIAKIGNLDYNEDINIHKLVAQLQLQILIGGTKNILVSQNKVLIDILESIKSNYESINIELIKGDLK